MKEEYNYMMKVRCPNPKCREVFEIPYKDRVNVVLFGHWEKYHRCGQKKIISMDDAGFKEVWVKRRLEGLQIVVEHL